jgi:hypothetical protein
MAALATGRTALVLEMCFEVLLHVIGSSELLLASRKGALNSLLCSVDLGVTRGMARSRKSLFAAVSVAIPAGIALSGTLGHRRGSGLADHLSVV